ncbi:hypothetical protein BJX99DRAFT_6323 [Aspergillus californicus]
MTMDLPDLPALPAFQAIATVIYPIYFVGKVLLSALSVCGSITLKYPVYYVAYCLYLLLALLSSPFIYLGAWVLWIISLPINVLISLRALIIYLGVASVIGAVLGLLLYIITASTIDLLLNRFQRVRTAARVKSRPGHRDIEGVKYTPPSESDLSSGLWPSWGWGLEANPSSLKKGGLFSETILEEESQESEYERSS